MWFLIDSSGHIRVFNSESEWSFSSLSVIWNSRLLSLFLWLLSSYSFNTELNCSLISSILCSLLLKLLSKLLFSSFIDSLHVCSSSITLVPSVAWSKNSSKLKFSYKSSSSFNAFSNSFTSLSAYISISVSTLTSLVFFTDSLSITSNIVISVYSSISF